MRPSDKLEYALDQTYLKRSEFASPEMVTNAAITIAMNIRSDRDFNYITRDNGAREMVKNITQEELIKFFVEQVINLYGSMEISYLEEIRTGRMSEQTIAEINYRYGSYAQLARQMFIIEQTKSNIITYYMTNAKELNELIEVVLSGSFNGHIYLSGKTKTNPQYGNEYRAYLSSLAKKDIRTTNALARLERDSLNLSNIYGLQFNPRAVNRCRNEVISGAQVKSKHNEYAEGKCLFASQDIGRRKSNQEDSVMISEHPGNSEFKLIAVADGVGGIDAGEIASNLVVRELERSFSKLPPDSYYDADLLVPYITDEIKRISNYVRTQTTGESTLTGAIICHDKTIIINVGDSRVYTIKDNIVSQLTEDDSLVYKKLQMRQKALGEPIELDSISDLRFAEGNNVIINAMGQEYGVQPQISTIPNTYDKLIAMTDGVHDLLSWKDIYSIVASTTKPEDITRLLVERARDYSVSKNGIEIPAGKDNITAAAYVRR